MAPAPTTFKRAFIKLKHAQLSSPRLTLGKVLNQDAASAFLARKCGSRRITPSELRAKVGPGVRADVRSRTVAFSRPFCGFKIS